MFDGRVAAGQGGPAGAKAQRQPRQQHHHVGQEEREGLDVPEVHGVVLGRGRRRRLHGGQGRGVEAQVEVQSRVVLPEAGQGADQPHAEDHQHHHGGLGGRAQDAGARRGHGEGALEGHHDDEPDGGVPEPVPAAEGVGLRDDQLVVSAHVVLRGQEAGGGQKQQGRHAQPQQVRVQRRPGRQAAQHHHAGDLSGHREADHHGQGQEAEVVADLRPVSGVAGGVGEVPARGAGGVEGQAVAERGNEVRVDVVRVQLEADPHLDGLPSVVRPRCSSPIVAYLKNRSFCSCLRD